MFYRFIHIVFIVITGFLFTGCAVLHDSRRCTANYFDENYAPKTIEGKIAMAPVAIPVGATALAIDGLIINPIKSLPGAFDNASFVFNDISFTGAFEIFVFPMRIVTFPVIFVVSETLRCTLPVDW